MFSHRSQIIGPKVAQQVFDAGGDVFVRFFVTDEDIRDELITPAPSQTVAEAIREKTRIMYQQHSVLYHSIQAVKSELSNVKAKLKG